MLRSCHLAPSWLAGLNELSVESLIANLCLDKKLTESAIPRSMPPSTATPATPVRPCTYSLTLHVFHDGIGAQKLTNSFFRGMAPVAHVLFNKFMKFNPKNPNWLNRDRFVLS